MKWRIFPKDSSIIKIQDHRSGGNLVDLKGLNTLHHQILVSTLLRLTLTQNYSLTFMLFQDFSDFLKRLHFYRFSRLCGNHAYETMNIEISRGLRNWSTQHRPLFLIKKISVQSADVKISADFEHLPISYLLLFEIVFLPLNLEHRRSFYPMKLSTVQLLTNGHLKKKPKQKFPTVQIRAVENVERTVVEVKFHPLCNGQVIADSSPENISLQ